jgi:surfactin family lipopeptide synthetase A/fengycin family lipopeptide synthetase D
LYGPTEATVDVTHYLCKNNCSGSIPIGKPIDNTQIFIINENNEVLPPNEKGELVICGVNLARGYLNRETLNNEKFVYLDIFGEKKRAYKTGDIAYYNSEGEIEYIGRNDNQIKLRGFRIELGEIENAIRTDEHVSDCSVIVNNPGQDNAMIVAFYVPKPNVTISSEVLKDSIRKRLPDYMIPSQCIPIDRLPLTNNGKLDKKALIDMVQKKQAEPVPIVSYATTEQIIYDIWCQLLGTPHIDMESNFFDVGGNSLLVVQMSLLIKEKLGIEIDMFDLFQYTSISALSAYLFDKTGTN